MLFLRLFGTFSANDDDRVIDNFRSSRARALLTYLTIEYNTPLWRDRLAALLWSDMPDERARRNLSVTLTRLQNALDSHTPGISEQLFNKSPHTIQMNPTAGLWCDALEFQQHLTAVSAHSHPDLQVCDECLAHLDAAVTLYRGEFLAGFAVGEAPLFDEWLTLARESYHHKMLGALNLLTECALARQEYQIARDYAQQQLTLEPWLEQAHYHLMVALVHLGKRSIALHQFERCRTHLEKEFGAVPGEAIQALYEQIKHSLEVVPPELSRPGSHTLPLPQNQFFGREQEQAQLETLLTSPETRLVTVLGSGGMGKTRLATKVGSMVRDRFPNGVWFISLVGVEANGEKEARAALVRAINEVLPLAHHPNMAPEQLLVATLRSQKLLLILDNMEQLRESAALLSDLLRAVPHLKVLCTSRAPLKLHAEWLFPLEGLPVSLPSNHLSVHAVPADDTPVGVQLFVARAQQHVPTFMLTAENCASLITICTATHGSPLGIELAAAMMRYRSPETLAVALQESLDAIYSKQMDVEARHRTLRAIFTSSWQLLEREEQFILGQLSLFRTPFTLESANAISGATAEHLDNLMDHSLLSRVGTLHYELHVLVREYAAECLTAAGDEESAHARYRSYFLGLLSEHDSALHGMEPRPAMEKLHAVMEDIRIAWYHSVMRSEVEALAHALPSLTRYMRMSDRIGDVGIDFEQDAIHLTDTCGYESTATLSLIGALWVSAAQTTLTHAPLDKLVDVAETIGQLAQYTHSTRLEAHGWRVMGLAQLLKGSNEHALVYLDRALAIARQSDDVQLLILCLGAYRTPLAYQHRAAEEALTLATTIGDGWMIGLLHINLAGAYYHNGNLVEAREAFQRAIAYYERGGHRRLLSLNLNNLGDVHRLLGQYKQAHARHQRALDISRNIGDRWNEHLVLEGMARYYRDVGDPVTARHLVEQALTIVADMGLVTAVALYYNILGLVTLEGGDLEQAEAAFTNAIRLSSTETHHQTQMESYAGMAQIAQARGQKKRAIGWVDAIVEFVLAGNRLGIYTDTPFIYWTCFEILKQTQDPRALLILGHAHSEFESIAATLPSSNERTQFWRVPFRRRLREAALHRQVRTNASIYPSSADDLRGTG